MRKFLAIILVVLSIFSVHNIPVFASDIASDKFLEERSIEKEVVFQKDYHIVTDMNSLIDMAKPIERNLLNESNSDIELYKVEQVMQEKKYGDGLIEKKIVTDCIALYSDFDYSNVNKEDDSHGAYDVAIKFSAYSTRFGYEPWSYHTERLDYITTSFTDMGTNPIYVKTIEMTTHGCPYMNAEVIYRNRVIQNPSAGITYSLNSDDDRLCDSITSSNTYGAAVYTFSNGASTDMYDLFAIMMDDREF